MESMLPNDPLYVPSFTVLGEYVNHHVEEEENEMFPEVKKLGLDLEALGEKMKERKDELVGEAA